MFTIKNFNKNFIMKEYNSNDEIINHITKDNQTRREEVFTFHLLCSFQRIPQIWRVIFTTIYDYRCMYVIIFLFFFIEPFNIA